MLGLVHQHQALQARVQFERPFGNDDAPCWDARNGRPNVR